MIKNSKFMVWIGMYVFSLLISGAGATSLVDDNQMILLKAISFDTSQGEPELPVELSIKEYPIELKGYYIVQFKGSVNSTYKESLENLGAEIYSYVPNNAFIVRMDLESKEKVQGLEFVQWVGVYQSFYKVSPEISVDKDILNITVLLFRAEDRESILKEFEELGGKITASANKVIRIEIAEEKINDIAKINGVEWIEEYIQPTLLNNVSRWVIQSYQSGNTPIWNHNITGAGQIIGISDSGLDYDSCFFWDSVQGAPPEDTGLPSTVTPNYNQRKVIVYHDVAGYGDYDDDLGHGTHTSGSIAGDNSAHIGGYDTNDGMAYNAKLVFQDLGQDGSLSIYPPADLNDLFQQAYNDSARIHSNSWGSASSSYTSDSKQSDEFMWNHKDFLILFANGNAGPSNNTVGSPATAKNVVSVGATENGALAENMASLSSHGPTDDGRLKPTVSAPGIYIYSADSDNNINSYNCGYVSMSGTSMATPTTAGASALVRQYFIDGFYPSGTATLKDKITPSGALIKAMLINSAREMNGTYTGGTIPSNGQGWGRILLEDALYFTGDARLLWVSDKDSVSTGASQTYDVTVTSEQTLKITLVWTDYPSTPAAYINLVNDVDLEVTSPGGVKYLGNVFSGGESTAGGSADRRNVEENVYLKNPEIGTYTIKVKGYNVPNGPQPFALVITGGLDVGRKGIVELDKELYSCSSLINVTLKDADLNQDNSSIEFFNVTITSTTEYIPEIIRMKETGNDTAIFTGAIRTASGMPTSDGILQVSNGDLILVTYRDADDGTGNPATAYDTATADCVAPSVSITSPINNTTYNTSRVALNYTVSESVVWVGYSLDGLANVTISGNTMLNNLSIGWHNVVVYARDIAGNIGKSSKVWFNVTTPDIWVKPEAFEIILPQGNITNRTLTIGNNGTGVLEFEISDIERQVYVAIKTSTDADFAGDTNSTEGGDDTDTGKYNVNDTFVDDNNSSAKNRNNTAIVADMPHDSVFGSTDLLSISGWPKTTGGTVWSSPALYDLDGDGAPEVVIGSNDGNLYAWHSDGSNVTGFPKQTTGYVRSSPAIGDLDGDGQLEILVGSDDDKLYAWHSDGSTVSGFPKTTGDSIHSSPALGDLDGDGQLEILVGSLDSILYAWNSDGSTVSGFPKTTGGSIWGTPALGDLNGDGQLEIVIGSLDNKLYAWHSDGSAVSGFPVITGGGIGYSSPALGDLDGDGQLEIVVGTHDGRLYAWHSDGSTVYGFPITIGYYVGDNSPVIGDFDGDGQLEIVVGSTNGKVYALHNDGTYVTGWPITTGGDVRNVALGDLDGDGQLEIVAGSDDLKVYAWHSDGSTVSGFPKIMGSGTDSNPAIDDLDGDGQAEIVIGSDDYKVYAWTVSSSYGRLDWPMFHHDVRHTGLYGSNVPREGWLSEYPKNGTVNPGSSMNITLTVNSTSLKVGKYNATIVINSNDLDETPLKVPVRLIVTENPPPDIGVKPDSFNITAVRAEVKYENLTIGNNGTGNLVFNVSYNTRNIEHTNAEVTKFLIIDHSMDKKYFANYSYVTISESYFSTLPTSEMMKYDVIYFEPAWSDYANLKNNMANLQEYIKSGGVAVINIAGNIGSAYDIDPAGTDYNRDYTSESETINDPTHAYITGQPYGGAKLIESDFYSWSSSDHGYLYGYPNNAETVLSNINGISWIHYTYGSGDVVTTTLTYGWGISGARGSPLDNLIKYASYISGEVVGDWLNVTPTSGIVPPKNQTNLAVEINTTGLDAGKSYNATIEIKHNDILHDSPWIVPVHLYVANAPHDIAVTKIDALNSTEVNSTISINSTISNIGLNNESNILVNFSMDGVYQGSRIISNLACGASAIVNFNWTAPSTPGMHTINISVNPVPGENITDNNFMEKRIEIITIPDICVYPEEFNLTLEKGTTVNKTLTIGNNGTGTLNASLSTSASTDLDLDNEQEIIVRGYYYDYTYAVNNSNLDTYSGWEWRSTYIGSYKGFAIADVNGDSIPELLEGENNYLRVYNVKDNTLLYNIAIPCCSYGGTAAGDIDNDGEVEVVRADYYGIDIFNGRTRALEKEIPVSYIYDYPDLVFGDANQNGIAEIYVGGYYGYVHAYEWDGTTSTRLWQSSYLGSYTRPCGFADADQDGNSEVFVGDSSGYLYALDASNGTRKGSVYTGYSSFTSCAIGDIDQDGTLEITTGNYDGYIRAYTYRSGSFTLEKTSRTYYGSHLGYIADSIIISGAKDPRVFGEASFILFSENAVSVPPKALHNITVTFDATKLNKGNYNATIVINSKDPDENPVNIPVQLRVVTPPHITSSSPANLTPIQYDGKTYTFSVVTDQLMENNEWILDDYKKTSTGTSSLTLTWNSAGVHNITYIGMNENGSVNLTWTVTVLSADTAPPSVTNAAANQSDIPDDTDYIPLWGETAQLNATVTDDSSVASVTVNLTELGGSASKPMLNIGDNIYSTTTNASAGTPPRLYNLTVNATDIYGNSNTSVKIQLKVMKNGDTTGNNVVNIGDALRLANNVSYPGNPAYALSSIYVADVTSNGIINIGDALRLANNVSYLGNPSYILK